MKLKESICCLCVWVCGCVCVCVCVCVCKHTISGNEIALRKLKGLGRCYVRCVDPVALGDTLVSSPPALILWGKRRRFLQPTILLQIKRTEDIVFLSLCNTWLIPCFSLFVFVFVFALFPRKYCGKYQSSFRVLTYAILLRW